ncbi:MAG: glycosyltransferase [Phycisphaerales bacterium]|nr:glycosyltransferase [Phycisphaerales bacterium]
MSVRRGPLRVLIVARHAPWPLNGGGRLRRYHYLAQLARHARCTVLLPVAPPPDVPWPAGVTVVAAVGAAGPEPQRSPAAGLRSARRHFGTNTAIAAWLQMHARLDHFDVALLGGATVGQYVDCLRVPAVWDPVDELVVTTVRRLGWHNAWRWLHIARQAARYARYESAVGHRCAATVVASDVDALWGRRWARLERLHVLTNGVTYSDLDVTHVAPEAGTLAFIGALDYPPNSDGIGHFVRTVWPQIVSAKAPRRLLIVGRDPTAEVLRLSFHPGIEIHPNVPDVRPYLARASVVVVPTRLGSGVKNKVLEACAAGRPVVASPRAVAGLTGRPGIEFRVARRPGDWIRELENLLANPVRAARLGLSGQRWVRSAHDWEMLGLALFELLRDAAGRPALPSATMTCSATVSRYPTPAREVTCR